MDAEKVYIRGKDWKDLKAVCVFEIESRLTVDLSTREMLDLAYTVRNSFVAHLGGPERLGDLM